MGRTDAELQRALDAAVPARERYLDVSGKIQTVEQAVHELLRYNEEQGAVTQTD
jgi:hypothetical protein